VVIGMVSEVEGGFVAVVELDDVDEV